jgi:hypothetical protein
MLSKRGGVPNFLEDCRRVSRPWMAVRREKRLPSLAEEE